MRKIVRFEEGKLGKKPATPKPAADKDAIKSKIGQKPKTEKPKPKPKS